MHDGVERVGDVLRVDEVTDGLAVTVDKTGTRKNKYELLISQL